MQQIGPQLGELFLQALPTVVIVLLFYLIMRSLFFGPLLQVMDEREARTRGAVAAADAAKTAAAEKIKKYEEALRNARATIYAEQDAARRKLLDERAAQVKAARAQATEEVLRAKARIAAEFSAARGDVEAASSQLAAEIARRVLESPSAGGPSSARGAR